MPFLVISGVVGTFSRAAGPARLPATDGRLRSPLTARTGAADSSNKRRFVRNDSGIYSTIARYHGRQGQRIAKLDGKVAVITGASSGIGEATAEALAAEGATVVVAARREDRREDRLDDLTGRINGDGRQALAVECDVTDEEQAHDLISRAKDEFGRVDILLNNAGVMLLSKIEKGLSDEWRQMFDVNASCTAA